MYYNSKNNYLNYKRKLVLQTGCQRQRLFILVYLLLNQELSPVYSSQTAAAVRPRLLSSSSSPFFDSPSCYLQPAFAHPTHCSYTFLFKTLCNSAEVYTYSKAQGLLCDRKFLFFLTLCGKSHPPSTKVIKEVNYIIKLHQNCTFCAFVNKKKNIIIWLQL